MSVNLMQIDEQGRERINPMFQDEEEKAFFEWISGLEMACPGVIIFRHRLTEQGQFLCSVPAAHEQLVVHEVCPPRYCGCPTCMVQRVAIRELTAWNITPIARKLAHEYLSKMQAMGGARKDGIAEQI